MRNISELQKIACVYKISNLLKPESFYIGSTYNLRKRITQHKSHIKLGTNQNTKFRNAVLKYGIDNFDVDVLECCLDNDLNYLRTREQYYLDLLKPKYNLSTSAFTPKNYNYLKRKFKKTATSSFIGVVKIINSTQITYSTVVCDKCKTYYVGRFKTELKAALEYNKFILKNKLDKVLNDLNISEEEINDIENKIRNKDKKIKIKKIFQVPYVGVNKIENEHTLRYFTKCIVDKNEIYLGMHCTPEFAALKYNEYVIENKLNRKLNIFNISEEEIIKNELEKQPKNSSIFKGVSYDKKHPKRPYCASIQVNKKQIGLGSYVSEQGAARAYNNYVVKNNLKYKLNELNLTNEEIDLLEKEYLDNRVCKLKGVVKDKRNKKNPYIASIMVNKKLIYLGRFDTELEAAKCYDKYVIENNLDRKINFNN